MLVELQAETFDAGERGWTDDDVSESRPRGHFGHSLRTVGLAAIAIVSALLACEAVGPPAVCGALPQQTIVVGESATVTACFDEPGGNTLVYKVWTSDAGVVVAAGSGATVTVTVA